MKKQSTKKLSMRSETVRVLGDNALAYVAGGGTTLYTCQLVTAKCYPPPTTNPPNYPPPTTNPPNFSQSCFNC